MLIQVQYLFLSIQLLTIITAVPLESEHKQTSRRPSLPVGSAEEGARKRSQEQRFCNETDHDMMIPKRRVQVSGQKDNGPPKTLQPADSRRDKKSRKVDSVSIFREEVDHYPEDEIKLALSQTPTELKELFNVLNTPMDPNSSLTERIAHRYNDDYGDEMREENICRTVTRFIYPREAKQDNTLVYIPNDNEFMQMIQVDICENPESECNYLTDMLPHGMSSACKQKYSMKKLLYLHPLEKKMASGAFPYPSCCSCVIKIPPIESRVSKLKSVVSSDGSNRKPPAMESSSGLTESLLSSINSTVDETRSKLLTADFEAKRRAKALGPTTARNNASNARQPCASETGRSTTRPSRQTSNKTLTVVLNDDKVYKPDNETRR